MGWRRLTTGERAAAREVFADALDYDRIRLYDRAFMPLQPRGTAIAPNGAIYFRRCDCLDDFAVGWRSMAWLVHELTHVWQHQTGVWVMLRGMVERRYRYGRLDPTRRLERWGIEQQAAIVEDWFRITRGHPPHRGSGSAADYRAVIPFLR